MMTLGSLKWLSRASLLQLTSASFVIEGLSTDTTLPANDRPVFVPMLDEGSATSDGPHHTPRGFSLVSPSRATRTYAFVLLLMFQSKRLLKSVRFDGSRRL